MSRRRFEVFAYRHVLARMRQVVSDRDIASAPDATWEAEDCQADRGRSGLADSGRPLPDNSDLATIYGRKLSEPTPYS